VTRKNEQHDARVGDTALRPVNPKDTGSQEPDISSLLIDVRDLICTAKSRCSDCGECRTGPAVLAYRRPNP